MPCGICEILHDSELTIEYANPYFYYLFASHNNEDKHIPMPSTLAKLLLPEEYQRIKAAFDTNIASGISLFDIETLAGFTQTKSTWLLARCKYKPEETAVSCVLLDISTHKRKEHELRAQVKKARLAAIDGLTGIPTRSATIEQINNLLSDYPRKNHALIMIDIDCFKQINDTMGHACGDKALQMIAKALKGSVRDCDVLGRLGGDEFVVCICDVSSMHALNTQLTRLLKSLHISCPHGTTLSGSLGASVFPRDGTSFHELYPKADAALYAAKDAGRNCFIVYTEQIHKSRPPSETAARD